MREEALTKAIGMYRRSLGSGLLLVAVLGATCGWACATEATLVADAHVNAARPAANSGAISNVNVGGGYTGLMQFDLGMLPVGTTATQISRAVLRVYVNRVDTAGLVSVAPVTSAWSEYGVTYGTMPSVGGAAQVFTVGQAGGFVAVDITGLVQGWVGAPATNFGVALTAGTAVAQFDSKENDLTAHVATLDVEIVSQGPAGAAGAVGPAGPQGPAGVAGARGATGLIGLTGPAGVAGASGMAGPAGPQGIQGLPGLGFEGAYASSTNYGLNDVVASGGSSYISLMAGNHGNTPGLSPGAWGVMAAMGAPGMPGPAGPAGSAGAAGMQGPKGDSGTPGAAGVAGAAGTPGLVYQGAYASTSNYALGDVVLWQGGSWASLGAGNHGNTPSLSPGQWGMLTAQGPQGLTGVAGAAGPTGVAGALGPVGPPGERGNQGLQGIAGQAGAQGLTGPKGDAGLSGPAGPQGQAGPVGLTFRGAYSSTTNYGLADGVLWQGASYVSTVAGNHGNTPDQSPGQWTLFAAAGPAGPQGPAVVNYVGNYGSGTNYGVADAVSYAGSTYVSLVASNHGNTPGGGSGAWAVLAGQGPQGPAGAVGPAGAAGPVGMQGAAGAAGPQGPPVSFHGGWLTGAAYVVGDAVSYGGGSYIALTGNSGRVPDISPIYWGSLAQAGTAGPAGPVGATGFQGPTGYPGPQGAAGVAGAMGPAGPAGPIGAAGPAGPQGATGATGAAGAGGLVYRGTYSSVVNYALNDAVIFQGSSYVALSPTTNAGNTPPFSPSFWGLVAAAGVNGAAGTPGQAGTPGVAGPSGPSGNAASVQVGSVTTGAAGTTASVVNTGSSSAAVLNFTIPQGARGVPGSGGGTGGGTSGVAYATMYHSVSYAATYYSVNNTNQSGSESPAVLSWVPDGCTATKLVVYSEQAATITVTLRTGLPGAMADTALACSVATGRSCTGTTPVAVAAGQFVELGITHADATAQPVWTALSCN